MGSSGVGKSTLINMMYNDDYNLESINSPA